MYAPPTTSYYARADDDDGSGMSKQNIIIIAVCSSVGAIFLGYFLYRNIRNCVQRSKSTPHPLPQPLSHHRQQQVAQMEQQEPRATWYGPQFAAGHQLRLDSARGSKASLLGSDSPVLASSITPSIDSPSAPSEDTSHQHLPIPTASYLHNRPSTSSSLTSSDASCPPPFNGQDLAAAIPPRPPSMAGRFSPVNTPTRRARPLSTSSTHTYGSTARASRLYGAPHAPHNQIQIILPTPLASANNSRDSLAISGRYGSDGFDRRSMADPWISISGHMSSGHRSTESLSLPQTAGRELRPRRRHASVGLPSRRMHPVLYEGENAPPLPGLRSVSEPQSTPPPVARNKSRRLEKRRTTQNGGTH